MIVDFHTHVVPPWVIERREEIAASDNCFSLLYSDPRSRLATSDEVIASMDECGIDMSVILNLSWQSHEMCVKTNDYILESIARYPERLIGFCAISTSDIDKAIEEMNGKDFQGRTLTVNEARPLEERAPRGDFGGDRRMG